jgi:hypothetical protein
MIRIDAELNTNVQVGISLAKGCSRSKPGKSRVRGGRNILLVPASLRLKSVAP